MLCSTVECLSLLFYVPPVSEKLLVVKVKDEAERKNRDEK